MESKRKLPLAFWIFVGLLVGIAAGMALMNISVGGIEGKDFAKAYIKPWGDIFLNLLKFVVVPIVLFSIAAGVISMKDISKVGSIGLKTIVYYMCTTAFAVILALILASVAKGMHWFPLLETSGLSYEAPAGQSFMDTIVSIFPSNAVQPLASATMLQVIVISLFLGFGVLLAGEKGLATAQIVDSLNEVFIKIMDVIIRLSPIGVACLICPVVAENGPKILSSLLTVLLVAYGGYIIHAAVVYSSTVKVLAGISPVQFFKGMAPAMMMAFSSASSVGALPFNMECTERLLCPAPGGHHQHGWHRHLPGRVLRVHRQLLRRVPDAGQHGDHRAHRHPGLHRHCRSSRCGDGHADHGAPERQYPHRGHRPGGGLFDMGRTTINITGDAACALIVSKMEDRKEARTRAVRG